MGIHYTYIVLDALLGPEDAEIINFLLESDTSLHVYNTAKYIHQACIVTFELRKSSLEKDHPIRAKYRHIMKMGDNGGGYRLVERDDYD